MKPGYWIGLMALIGAIVAYAVFQGTGWLNTGIGAVVGILIGTIIYMNIKGKQKGK